MKEQFINYCDIVSERTTTTTMRIDRLIVILFFFEMKLIIRLKIYKKDGYNITRRRLQYNYW